MKALAIAWHVASLICIGLWFTSIFLPQVGDRAMYFIFAMICSLKGDVAGMEANNID